MPRLTSLLAATTSIAVIASVYLWQQLRTERELSAQLRERVTQMEIAQQRAPQARSVVLAAESPRPLPASGTVAAGPAPIVASTGQGPVAKAAASNVRTGISINLAELMKDPDFREAQRVQTRLQMPQLYPDLARELGLTPAEADAFFDLLARQRSSMMANSISPDASDEQKQEAQRASTELLATQQAELESMLGSARYQQWKDYQQTMGARQQLSQLRTTLSSAGSPLTDDQAKPLLATMIAEQKRRTDEVRSRAYPTDSRAQLDFAEQNLKVQEESNDRVLDAAQSYLTAQQLTALKSSMIQQSAISRALMKAQRAQQEAGGNPAGTPAVVILPVP